MSVIDILTGLEQMGNQFLFYIFQISLKGKFYTGAESVTFDELREFGFGDAGSWQQPFHAEVRLVSSLFHYFFLISPWNHFI